MSDLPLDQILRGDCLEILAYPVKFISLKCSTSVPFDY